MLSFFVSCNREDKMKFTLSNFDSGIVEITNHGRKTADFTMQINGRDFSKPDTYVHYIKTVNEEYAGEPQYMKVFSFVCNYTWHDNLVTRHSWAYSPFVLVNSLGGGLCGFRSALLTNLLRDMSFDARSLSLNGHVVTEVFIGEKWILFDPDFGVYYFNEKGEIASYSEICENSSLITEPIKPVLFEDNIYFNQAYSLETALLYTSTFDNSEFDVNYDPYLKNPDVVFHIPAGAIFTFPFNKSGATNYYAYGVLKLPNDFTGKLSMPFVIAGISGEGEIKYLNRLYNIHEFDGNSVISKSEIFSFEIEIVKNKGNVRVYYYVNPYIYSFPPKCEISIKGHNLSDLKIKFIDDQSMKLALPNQKDFLYQKIEGIYLDVLDTIAKSTEEVNYGDFELFFITLIETFENDSTLNEIIDFNGVYLDYESLMIEFKKEPNKDYSVYYSADYAVPALRNILIYRYKKETNF